MIKYRLKCANGHLFDAWFLDGATYDRQNARRDISCPFCGDGQISKAPMAPNLAKNKFDKQNEATEIRATEVAERILNAVNKMRKNVEENCEYVGDKFADEARGIFYGETEERGIYGEASEEESVDLEEEGIEFFRLPTVPRRND